MNVKNTADSMLVKFRMIVFRPFKGEIMLGKIASGTEHGIKSASAGAILRIVTY